jgi:hypothetical protein
MNRKEDLESEKNRERRVGEQGASTSFKVTTTQKPSGAAGERRGLQDGPTLTIEWAYSRH